MVYRTIPYKSLSSLNVDNDINKNQMNIYDKTKSKTPSIRNSILKNENKILMNAGREIEKRTTKRYEKVDNKDLTLIDISGKKVQENYKTHLKKL
jgi:hypothetical protein